MDYSTLKNVDLAAMLEARGLKKTGTKPEMTARLLRSDAGQSLPEDTPSGRGRKPGSPSLSAPSSALGLGGGLAVSAPGALGLGAMSAAPATSGLGGTPSSAGPGQVNLEHLESIIASNGTVASMQVGIRAINEELKQYNQTGVKIGSNKADVMANLREGIAKLRAARSGTIAQPAVSGVSPSLNFGLQTGGTSIANPVTQAGFPPKAAPNLSFGVKAAPGFGSLGALNRAPGSLSPGSVPSLGSAPGLGGLGSAPGLGGLGSSAPGLGGLGSSAPGLGGLGSAPGLGGLGAPGQPKLTPGGGLGAGQPKLAPSLGTLSAAAKIPPAPVSAPSGTGQMGGLNSMPLVNTESAVFGMASGSALKVATPGEAIISAGGVQLPAKVKVAPFCPAEKTVVEGLSEFNIGASKFDAVIINASEGLEAYAEQLTQTDKVLQVVIADDFQIDSNEEINEKLEEIINSLKDAEVIIENAIVVDSGFFIDAMINISRIMTPELSGLSFDMITSMKVYKSADFEVLLVQTAETDQIVLDEEVGSENQGSENSDNEENSEEE